MKLAFALLANALIAAAQAPSEIAVYQEIPAGSMDTKEAGTGYVLTLKCAPIPRTIHLWLNGALLYELVPEDPSGAYSVSGRRLIAKNFNLSNSKYGTCGNGPCNQFRVDYLTKDSSCAK